MSFKKKISAVAAAAAVMALSLSSCGKSATWGANIDGTEIRAGIMILFQSDAVSEAQQYVTDENSDVLAITIEDKPSKDWINDKVVESMREYAAVEHKFDELGLTIEDSDKKSLSNTVDQWWEYIGEYYEGLGISKQSYQDVALNGQKRNKIFEYYYGQGGEKEVSEQEIKDYLDENNARIKYIEMPLKDGEGNLLKSAGKAEIKEMAEGYIDRMRGGESFETIEKEYKDYYDGLVAAAAENSDGNTVELNVGDGSTAAAGESTTEKDTAEEVNYGTVITAEATAPSAKVAETVFGGTLNVGDYTLVEENEVYYIVYRMDLFADETYLDNQRDTVLQTLKGDEFDQTVQGWLEGQDVQLNDAAFKKYKPEKHIEEK